MVRTLVLYTLPPDSLGHGRALDEFDLSGAAEFVASTLEGAMAHPILGHPAEVVDVLNKIRPEVIFNLCEAPLGRPDLEAHVAALFEWAGVRFTGCGSETLALCRRKDVTSALLRSAGIAVPADVDPVDPRFPCVVKPAAEDGSVGIHDHSLCHDVEGLRLAMEAARGPTIVQEFLPGREFSVSLWGARDPEHHAIGETTRVNGSPLITYEAKWTGDDEPESDRPRQPMGLLDPEVEQAILQAARSAWRVVGARHALRIDIRLDRAGTPRILDVNPNPALLPGTGICRAVQEAGWPLGDFFRALVDWT